MTSSDPLHQGTEAEKVIEDEHKSVRKATKLNSRLIYEVVRRDGEDELRRPLGSLIFSGFAAGIFIAMSILGESILRRSLPDAPWRHLVENLGYSMGFLIVILGRMQLFTENTITTVLPLVARPRWDVVRQVARLWCVVLAANVVGAFVAALWIAHVPALPPELRPIVDDLAHHAVVMPPETAFFRAIPAGLLIAALVWMMPQAGSEKLVLIIIVTWLIAAGDFAHIVAGSVEMAFLMVTGQLGPVEGVAGWFLPVLAGNVFGGTAIFALLAWGQVRQEVS